MEYKEGGYSDFFQNLFGRANRQQASSGPGNRQFHYESQPRGRRDLEHGLQVTLDEAFHGTRRVLEWEGGRKIDAKIPRGVKTGSRVRLKGQGGPGGGTGGNPGWVGLAGEGKATPGGGVGLAFGRLQPVSTRTIVVTKMNFNFLFILPPLLTNDWRALYCARISMFD